MNQHTSRGISPKVAHYPSQNTCANMSVNWDCAMISLKVQLLGCNFSESINLKLDLYHVYMYNIIIISHLINIFASVLALRWLAQFSNQFICLPGLKNYNIKHVSGFTYIKAGKHYVILFCQSFGPRGTYETIKFITTRLPLGIIKGPLETTCKSQQYDTERWEGSPNIAVIWSRRV